MLVPSGMKETTEKSSRGFFRHFRRNVFAGIFTIIPLWLTWIVFTFILETLSDIGKPTVQVLSDSLGEYSPSVAHWLTTSSFQGILAALLTVVGLYFLGWMTTQVIGRRLLQLVDTIINKIPLAQTIYGASKKLITVLSGDQAQDFKRVVLIDFPSDNLKTVGFVTAVFKEAKTDEDLASVYVPTTPNPTSGYLEIVPISRIIETKWTFDEAMTFIISGGAVSPESMPFYRPDELAKREVDDARISDEPQQ